LLTYRQIECLWERYWDRKLWDIEVQAAMNPFGGSDEDETNPDGSSVAIDATTDEGLAQLQSMGLPIKVI